MYDQLVERAEPGGASPEAYQGWTLGAEAPITAGVVRSIGELLVDDNVPPELRASLAQVLAGLEGAAVRSGVVDPAGRPAVGVRIETEHQLHTWWFDPHSLQLLASTNVEPDEDPDEVTVFWLVAEAGFVPSIESSRPRDPLSLRSPCAKALVWVDAFGFPFGHERSDEDAFQSARCERASRVPSDPHERDRGRRFLGPGP